VVGCGLLHGVVYLRKRRKTPTAGVSVPFRRWAVPVGIVESALPL